jgi:hypothetical protein
MSQPLKVAGFEVIISGRFRVITKVTGFSFSHLSALRITPHAADWENSLCKVHLIL